MMAYIRKCYKNDLTVNKVQPSFGSIYILRHTLHVLTFQERHIFLVNQMEHKKVNQTKPESTEMSRGGEICMIFNFCP